MVAVPAICTLVLVSAADLRRRLIPNRVLLPAWAFTLAANTSLHPDRALEWFGWSLGAGAFFLVAARLLHGGLGMGDVKLIAFLGALLGSGVLPALVVGTSAGAVGAAVILLRHGGAGRKRTMPYGPFIAFGALAMLLF